MLLANNNLDTREITLLLTCCCFFLPPCRPVPKKERCTNKESLPTYIYNRRGLPQCAKQCSCVCFPFFVPFLFSAFCVVDKKKAECVVFGSKP